VLPVAPGSANIDRPGGRGHRFHSRTHGLDRPGHFGRGFAPIGQLDQCGDNGLVRNLAIEDPAKQHLGFAQAHRGGHVQETPFASSAAISA